ncbi:unnamed protein product [Closterium sp. Yama58-4]|nr:unnamed protein product [Closterium sp. Yama58-4]
MELDSAVALSATSAARNSAARAAPRAVHTGVRSVLEAPQISTLYTSGMRSHHRVPRWNRSIRLTRRPPALIVALLVAVAVLGNGSSLGSSSNLPRETPCCSPSSHSTLAPLARLATDAHDSIHAIQRFSRRLLQESPASSPDQSSSPLQSRPLFITLIAACAALILVIASIGFCMCCRQARRAESSFDEAFLADYIARSAHHYDPLLKLGSGQFGDSFPCSGPDGEPWLVVRATIPDNLAGATWLPWTGAAAKKRAFNEEIIRCSGLSHPHLLHLIGWSDQPLGQAGGSRRLRQVGESMRQWAQILWRKRGAQEQGDGGGSGRGDGVGSGRGERAGSGRGEGEGSGRGEGEGEGSGRAEGEASGEAGMQGRAVGIAGGEEGEERGKAGDQSVASDSDSQSPPPLAFSQRLDLATAIAEALSYLHTVTQPALVHRLVSSSSVFLEVLPVARLANLGIIKGLPGSPCLLQQCHVAAPHRDPDWWERIWPTPRTDIYGLGIIMLELLSGCPATTTDQATASTISFDVQQMLDSIATDDIATVLDPSIAAQSMPIRPIRSFARLAARCAAPAARSRPDISTVVSELQGISRAMIRLSMARTTAHNSFVSRADSCLDSPEGSEEDSPEDSSEGSREELPEDSHAGSPEFQTQEPVDPSWNGRGQFQKLG